MDVGIEVGAGRLHSLDSVVAEMFYQLVVYQLHAIVYGLCFGSVFGCFESALKVIDYGQQVFEGFFGGVFD